MADKIKSSYKFSKSFYDDAITQGKWWSKLYFKLLWGGVDDNEIARRVLAWIPDDFKGKLLDVPVGTAVFTTEKYKRMKLADITCLDYSQDMLEQAEYRFRGAGITNIKAAIEREQSDARINSAEREQARPQVKNEAGSIQKCNIVLKELGGKFENEYVCAMLGNLAACRFYEGDVVMATLRFSTHEYQGQVFQEILVTEIVKLN